MIRIVIISLSLLLTAGIFDARSQDSSRSAAVVQGTVESTTVVLGDRITFTIEVANAEVEDVEVINDPTTSGLVPLHRRPAVSRAIDIVSGHLISTVRYRYIYQAIGEGAAGIGSVDVTVRGRTHSTEAISLTVVADRTLAESMRDLPLSQTEDIFIRGTLSTDTAYVHEQLIVEYHLFYREGVQLRQSRMAGSWDTPGFWREDMNVDLRPTPDRRIVNGLAFNSILLKRAALYPTRDGRLRVEPFRIESEVRGRSGDPRDPFAAYRNRFRNVEISSNAVEVHVRPLPQPSPPSFGGAVGRFELLAPSAGQQPRAPISTGEPLRFHVEIRGLGNLPLIRAPELRLPDAFDRFETIEETHVDLSGSRPAGTRSFGYTAVPVEPGAYALPGFDFSYFDPEYGRYVTIASDTLRLVVEGEPLAAGTVLGTRSIIREIGDVSRPVRALYQQPWAYVPLGIPIAAWLLLPGVARIRRRRQSEASSQAKRTAREAVHREVRRLRSISPGSRAQPLRRLVEGDDGSLVLGSTRQKLISMLEEARYAPPAARPELLQAVLDMIDRELTAERA